MDEIRFYNPDRPYGWLSNFHHAPMRDRDERLWPTVEHAFQAMKTLDPDQRERIRRAATPGAAKGIGRRVALRPGWDMIRVAVMERLLAAKFAQHPTLAAQLVATGQVSLIENAPRDFFWGCGANGSGRNQLGQALMRLREQLQAASDGPASPAE